MICSAILKGYAIAIGKFNLNYLSSDPRLSLLIVDWEIILGIWLVLGKNSLVPWLFSFLTFLGFAITGFVLALSGFASCGCLGLLQVNPWIMFTVDVAALLLLLKIRPALKDVYNIKCKQAIPFALVIIFGITLAILCESTQFGQNIKAKIRGDQVVLRQSKVNLGIGQMDEWLEHNAEAVNWSSETVRIYGGTSACNFDILQDCPIDIKPLQEVKLRVRLHLKNPEGIFVKQEAAFWVSNDSGTIVWELPITLIGVLSENPAHFNEVDK